MLAVTLGLELDQALRTVVHTAIELTEVGCCAFGVLAADSELVQVIYKGLDEGLPTGLRRSSPTRTACRRARSDR